MTAFKRYSRRTKGNAGERPGRYGKGDVTTSKRRVLSKPGSGATYAPYFFLRRRLLSLHEVNSFVRPPLSKTGDCGTKPVKNPVGVCLRRFLEGFPTGTKNNVFYNI